MFLSSLHFVFNVHKLRMTSTTSAKYATNDFPLKKNHNINVWRHRPNFIYFITIHTHNTLILITRKLNANVDFKREKKMWFKLNSMCSRCYAVCITQIDVMQKNTHTHTVRRHPFSLHDQHVISAWYWPEWWISI